MGCASSQPPQDEELTLDHIFPDRSDCSPSGKNPSKDLSTVHSNLPSLSTHSQRAERGRTENCDKIVGGDESMTGNPRKASEIEDPKAFKPSHWFWFKRVEKHVPETQDMFSCPTEVFDENPFIKAEKQKRLQSLPKKFPSREPKRVQNKSFDKWNSIWGRQQLYCLKRFME